MSLVRINHCATNYLWLPPAGMDPRGRRTYPQTNLQISVAHGTQLVPGSVLHDP